MEEYFLVKLNETSFYGGVYSGELNITTKDNAMAFKSKDDIFVELTSLEWIQDDSEEEFGSIEIVNMAKFK